MMPILLLVCAITLLNAIPFPIQAAAEESASQVGAEELDAKIVEIKKEFFYEIPAEKQGDATDLLAGELIVEIDAKQVGSLLGKQPDIEDRIEKISEKYFALAEFDASGAANPSLKKYAEKFLADSKESIEYAEYYRRLKERVRPFLLIGMASGQQNARFHGIRRGNTLRVVNAYLGSPSTDETFPVPVIVYLRNKPENVETSTLSVK